MSLLPKNSQAEIQHQSLMCRQVVFRVVRKRLVYVAVSAVD
ncbi:hypothetical protein [Escherichia coli]